MLNKNNQPLVSIGIPTYNRPNLLCRAIDCAVNQSYKNLEIIISDNSTPGDQVEGIVKKYLESDSRIVFNKFDRNYGPGRNMEYLISHANGKYFMFLADDDSVSLEFVENNLQFLENNDDYVGSISPVRFEGCGFDEIKMGDNSLEDEIPVLRVIEFLGYWHANARFSSLMRLPQLKSVFDVNEHFLGNDWYMIIKLVMLGKFKRINNGEVIFGMQGMSNNNIFALFKRGVTGYVFPLKDLSLLTYNIIKDGSFRHRLQVVYGLMMINLKNVIYRVRVEVRDTIKGMLKI